MRAGASGNVYACSLVTWKPVVGPCHDYRAVVHDRRVLPVSGGGRLAAFDGCSCPPPRLDYESHAAGLERNELGALLVAAGLGPP
jgi:hypothetical protein